MIPLEDVVVMSDYFLDVLSIAGILYQNHDEPGSIVPEGLEPKQYLTLGEKLYEIMQQRFGENVSESEKLKFFTWLMVQYSCLYVLKTFPDKIPLPEIIEQEIKYSFIKENPELY